MRIALPSWTISAAGGAADAGRLRDLYRALVFPRLVEEKMLILLRQGRLSKWFSGIGQEAIAVGVTAALRPDDPILPLHRNLGVFTGRGLDLLTLFRQLLGRDGGYTRGRDRTFHFGAPAHHVIGMISHLGAMLPVADGMALGFQLKGEDRVAAVFSGEGGTSEGDFHEAVNLAAVWKLPVIFVIENNQYGLSTPVDEQYACARLSDRGIGYGIAAETADGNDLPTVIEAIARAAARARAGEGPTLLEFMTFRMRGHEEASGTAYVPKHLFDEWSAKDPIARFEQRLLDDGVLSRDERDAIRTAFKAHIDEVADQAYDSPEPDSTAERELADVYHNRDAAMPPPTTTMPRCRKAAKAITTKLPQPPRRARSARRPPRRAKRAPSARAQRVRPRERERPPSERSERPRGERREPRPRTSAASAPPRAQRAPLRCATSTRSAMRSASSCVAIRASSCWGRTSPSTAEPSR